MERLFLYVLTFAFGMFFLDLIVGFIESFTAQISLFDSLIEQPTNQLHWK